MTLAYVDTSCLVAIAFGERGATALARRLEAFDDPRGLEPGRGLTLDERQGSIARRLGFKR